MVNIKTKLIIIIIQDQIIEAEKIAYLESSIIKVKLLEIDKKIKEESSGFIKNSTVKKVGI